MDLFSIFKTQSGAAPAAVTAQGVADARTRAKRRLLGAVVLLGIGVIAFPLLFESQPRPIPVDIAIEIPRKDGAPPLAVPPPRPAAAASKAAAMITETKSDAAKDVALPVAAKPKPEAAPKDEPVQKVEAAPKVEPAPKAAEAAPRPIAAPKADVKPPPAAAKPPVEAAGRFVVQIGAFADASGVRDTRAKVEKLGLRTYTQAVDSEAGKRTRVRLGPFVSRDEAEQAAAKVKAAGLPATVLAL